MTGRVSIAQSQGTQNTDAIASLKAILNRYCNRKSDGFPREHGAARKRGRDPISVSTDGHGDPTVQWFPTSTNELTTSTSRGGADSDATAQSKLHAGHTREPPHNLSPSSFPQSEDAFTPDLSVDAVRELSLLRAGLLLLTGAVPQTDNGLRDQASGNGTGFVATGASRITPSFHSNQFLCPGCTMRATPSHRWWQNQFEHVYTTYSACGKLLDKESLDVVSFQRNDGRFVELPANRET